MELGFIDTIYEAAIAPELWKGTGLLDQLARRSHARDGVLMAMSPDGDFRWIANDSGIPKVEAYVRDNWGARNPYLLSEERSRRFNEPRFLMDTEIMSIEEMQDSEYYQGFMKPMGCFWHAGTGIMSPSGDQIKLSVHRSFEEGPLPPEVTSMLTEIRPHLARAALLASRLKFEQIKSTVDSMGALGIWAAALKNGRLVVANESFARLIPDVVRDARHRLVVVQKSADQRWSTLLESHAARLGGSFPIAASEEHRAMVVHALPIRGAANDIFNAADLLLAVTPVLKEAKVDDGILAGLYDLTPAEADVAKEIGSGRSVEDIAKSRDTSVGTIRSQLHAVYDKTGSRRQIDLARLVLGLARYGG